MRIHSANLLVGMGVAALLAYGLWSMDGALKTYVGIGSFAYFLGTLGPAIGIEYEPTRNARVLKVVCAVFFVIGLILNTLFASFSWSSSLYVVSTAISFLVFVFVGNAVYTARQ